MQNIRCGSLFTIGRMTGFGRIRQSYDLSATCEVIHDACRTYDGRAPVVNLVCVSVCVCWTQV